MTERLLPCPFCGSTKVENDIFESGCANLWYTGSVSCKECEAEGPTIDLAEVTILEDGTKRVIRYEDAMEASAKAWNSRVSVFVDLLNIVSSNNKEDTKSEDSNSS